MYNILKKIFIIVFLLGAALPALAADRINIVAHSDMEIISIRLENTEPRKLFIIDNPDRLVVDVPVVSGKVGVGLPEDYHGELIKNVRAGLNNATTTRFVFELNHPAKIIKQRVVGKKNKELEIVISPTAKTTVNQSLEKPKSKETEETESEDAPILATKGQKKPEAKRNWTTKAEEVKTQEKTNKEKPLIIIDPGHGGIDPGAIGPNGTQEKRIVLDVARTIKAHLIKSGRYRVKMTREDDRFIVLRQRVAIARQAKGDVFLSIHADSAPNDMARGLSVYTLSEKASDKEAAALAARENKVDVLAGLNLEGQEPDVADILISLAQRDTNNRSSMLADFLVTSLDERVKLLSNTHRFAGFAVLRAPDIPSALIEVGFITHPQEEKLLNTKTYHDKVAAGIVKGLDAYFKQVKTVGSKL